MGVSGFESVDKTSEGQERQPDWFDEIMTDPVRYMEYLMVFFGAQYHGQRYFTSFQQESLRAATPHISGQDQVNLNQLSEAFGYCAQSKTAIIQLNQRDVTVRQDAIFHNIPDDVDVNDPDQYPGITAEEAYQRVLLARSNPHMANGGIRIFEGPERDMAMYLAAAKFVGIAVENEDHIRNLIGEENMAAYQTEFESYVGSDSRLSSEAIDDFIRTPSNSRLRQDLYTAANEKFDSRHLDDSLFDTQSQLDGRDATFKINASVRILETMQRLARDGDISKTVKLSEDPENDPFAQHDLYQMAAARFEQELASNPDDPEIIKSVTAEGFAALEEAINLMENNMHQDTAEQLRSLGRYYIDRLSGLSQQELGAEPEKWQSLAVENLKTIDFEALNKTFAPVAPASDYNPETDADGPENLLSMQPQGHA